VSLPEVIFEEKAKVNKLTERELYERYNDMLDDIYPDLTIADYSYNTSRALKLIDETAYRCGFNDWLDSELGETIWEKDGEYFDSDPESDSEE
jgi:hypothetical protein